jgi:predicted DCC family thiol-disulfide oxidoreductase YuxK
VPGFLLSVISILLALAVIRELLDNPAALVSLALLMVPLAILWWMWSQIPAWFRKAIYRMLKRKREGEDRRRD